MGADDLKASANAEALMGADVLLPAAEGRGKGAFFDASPFCPCAGAAAVLLAIEESPGAPAQRASVVLQKPHHWCKSVSGALGRSNWQVTLVTNKSESVMHIASSAGQPGNTCFSFKR